MGRINVLDTKTANAIKAGEVIERPVSVVKELFDNALDSGASRITIEYENGGITKIQVTDNGIGMDKDDAVTAFQIHATSKIKSVEDLFNLTTMGFRGEALASIAACSRVSLTTKQADTDIGTRVRFEDGSLLSVEECSSDNGTVVTVCDLFYNTPARYKFLKKDSTEGMYICSLVEKLAVVNPHISIKLIKDNQVILNTPGNGSMLDTIYCIYGKSISSMLIPVDYMYDTIHVKGFVGKPDLTRGNRALELFYVNDRSIKSATATAAIDEAYRNKVMKGKFPICFLCMYVDPSLVDCNVHPQKIEVKFTNDSDVFRAIYHATQNALESLVSKSNQANTQDELLSLISDNSEDDDNPVESTSITSTVVSSASPSVSYKNYDSVSKPTQVEIRASNNILNILSGIDTAQQASSKEDIPFEVTPNPQVELVEPVIATEEEFKSTKNSEIMTLINSKIVGTLFATYIVLQSDDAAYILDQHAAHERVLYEEFLVKFASADKDKFVEQLLVPEIVSLSLTDYSLVVDNIENFLKYGFEVEPMGDREVALRTVPLIKGRKSSYVDMFKDLIAEMGKELPTGDDAWFHKIATAACKAAIKGHDLITVDEIKALLNSMLTLDDPYHCPHGRPTFVKLTNTDIEKMFKRIV